MDELEAQHAHQQQQEQQFQHQQKAQEGNLRRAETRDLVSSWVLAIWALATGLYLTLGGAKHLVSPAYTYVLQYTGGDYHIVGAALLLAGVFNILAVGMNKPLALGIGAILCGTWLLAMSWCMGLASINVNDGGNLNWTTAAGLGACFFIRAYNKIDPPRLPPVMGFLTLAALLWL